MLFIPVGFFYSYQPLSFRWLGDSHRLMQISSGIGVMSSVYGVVNFVLLRIRVKLTSLMDLLASLYVTSLFLPKNTPVSCPHSMALSILVDGLESVAFLLLFIHWKKGCLLMAS